jgi:hypothetical protein
MVESLGALRRANPRIERSFPESVDAVARAVRARTASTPSPALCSRRSNPRRRVAGVSAAGAALAVAAAAAVFVLMGSPAGPRAIEDATAAVRKAATLTAASAERSGTAVMQITKNGEMWAGLTIRWHGEDLSLSHGEPQRRGRAGAEFLLVDGTMYAVEDGEWVNIGSPESIDPDSGTTPAEYLAAVREDVGGATLRRITEGMTGLTRRELEDGSTVYSGSVAAGLIARETGFKEGQAIRVFPFGYVAHDDAADPAAPLDAAVTVGVDGLIREIAFTWGGGASWAYTVTYSQLGATPAPVAPKNARPLRDR